VETERISTEVPRPAGLPSSGDESLARSIPVEAAPPESAEPEISSDQPLALPEFPLPEAPAPPPLEKMSLRSGDDSLTDWVGRALSSFTGDSPNDDGDPSPAGVADPSLFGRESSDGADVPGALDPFADALPPTNAFRGRTSAGARMPVSEDPRDLPSEAHSRGIPSSIPPFRRSTDPRNPLGAVSPLDREDDVVAGMWQHDPADAGPPAAPIPPASGGRSEPSRAEPGAPAPSSASSMASSASSEASGGPARSRDEIADSILQGSLEQLPRVLLLASGRTGVTGWRGRGPALTPEIVSSIRLPTSEISVFSSVQESGIPHFGAIDRAEWPGALAAIFGAAPPDCAIFPIRLLDGVAAFLYADRLGGPMQYEDFAIVARAAASAANVLSRFLLRSEKSEKSERSEKGAPTRH